MRIMNRGKILLTAMLAALIGFSAAAADRFGKGIQAGRALRVSPGEIKVDDPFR